MHFQYNKTFLSVSYKYTINDLKFINLNYLMNELLFIRLQSNPDSKNLKLKRL